MSDLEMNQKHSDSEEKLQEKVSEKDLEKGKESEGNNGSEKHNQEKKEKAEGNHNKEGEKEGEEEEEEGLKYKGLVIWKHRLLFVALFLCLNGLQLSLLLYQTLVDTANNGLIITSYALMGMSVLATLFSFMFCVPKCNQRATFLPFPYASQLLAMSVSFLRLFMLLSEETLFFTDYFYGKYFEVCWAVIAFSSYMGAWFLWSREKEETELTFLLMGDLIDISELTNLMYDRQLPEGLAIAIAVYSVLYYFSSSGLSFHYFNKESKKHSEIINPQFLHIFYCCIPVIVFRGFMSFDGPEGTVNVMFLFKNIAEVIKWIFDHYVHFPMYYRVAKESIRNFFSRNKKNGRGFGTY